MGMDEGLIQTILSIRDPEELYGFFRDLLTPSELEDISLRWKLLQDLHSGMAQRKIAAKYGISLCKITRGSKILKKKSSTVLKMLEGRSG